MVKNNISNYILVHLFTTLEQEFSAQFIVPFQDKFSDDLSSMECRSQRYKLINDILIGKHYFSLGNIKFFAIFINSSDGMRKCMSIEKFTEFLGDDVDQFIDLCKNFTNITINGLNLVTIRNGLAHGDGNVINRIPNSAESDLENIFFKSPNKLLLKILSLSKKQKTISQ